MAETVDADEGNRLGHQFLVSISPDNSSYISAETQIRKPGFPSMDFLKNMFTMFILLNVIAIPGWAFEKQDTVKDVQALDYRKLSGDENSLYRRGEICVGTGISLIPLSLLALVPVVYPGAFGITAADPGFSGYLAVASLGLIHIGIPMMGYGADKLDEGVHGLHPESQSTTSTDWSHYRHGWTLMGWGGVVFVTAIPVVAASVLLNWDNRYPQLEYAGLPLLITGAGLGAAGLIEQEYSGYMFSRRHNKANSVYRALSSVSLQPVFRLGRQGADGAGLNLVAGF